VRVGGRALADAPGSAPGPGTSAVGVASTPDAGSALVLDPGAAVAEPDWAAALAAADSGRSRALASGDTEALRVWVDPTGTAWRSDAALASRVAGARARIVGGALVVQQVLPQEVSADRAVLLVQDRREAYSVVTASGTSAVPARGARWWRVTLSRAVPADGSVGWRLRDVAPDSGPGGDPSGAAR
jgi:hypothetical protein